MAKSPKAAAKKPRAAKVVSTKSPAKAVTKTDKPRKDRRGTPKGKGVTTGGAGIKRSGPKPKGRIGNPPFEPTVEQRAIVKTHAAVGTPHWLIADVAFNPPISVDTLTKYFGAELETGLLQVNARIGSLIATQAFAGCRSSQRLWITTRGGWKVQSSTELTGADGAPLAVAALPARNPSLTGLSKAELKQYLKLQRKIEGVPDASDG